MGSGGRRPGMLGGPCAVLGCPGCPVVWSWGVLACWRGPGVILWCPVGVVLGCPGGSWVFALGVPLAPGGSWASCGEVLSWVFWVVWVCLGRHGGVLGSLALPVFCSGVMVCLGSLGVLVFLVVLGPVLVFLGILIINTFEHREHISSHH